MTDHSDRTEEDFDQRKTYRLRLADCCIEGEINAGRFIKCTYDDEVLKEGVDKFVFENCTIGPHWGAWEVVEEEWVDD